MQAETLSPSDLRARLLERFAWVGDAGTPSSAADRTGWLRDPQVLASIGSALAAPFEDAAPSVVLGPASSGFSLAALVALHLGAGFVGVGKEKRDLADSDKWFTAATPLDYRGRNMDMSVRASLLADSPQVLVVDDWADTGGQLLALKTLVSLAGAKYVGAAVIVDGLTDHAVRRDLALTSLLSLRDLRRL